MTLAALDDYMNLVRSEREGRPAEAMLVDEIDVLRTVVRALAMTETYDEDSEIVLGMGWRIRQGVWVVELGDLPDDVADALLDVLKGSS